jgi:hypothetical protein
LEACFRHVLASGGIPLMPGQDAAAQLPVITRLMAELATPSSSTEAPR